MAAVKLKCAVEELVSLYYNIAFAGDSVEKFRRFL
jgi:hypothetical protein